MARSTPTRPSVEVNADHELITPDTRNLRGILRRTKPGEIDPVVSAEAALAGLSGEFSDWMTNECKRLDIVRRKIQEAGLTRATREEIFLAAHDIKGDAGVFGYPEVAAAADSLCRLLEHAPDLSKVPTAIIDQHVDAIRAIVREHGRPGIATVAAALTSRLRAVTDEFLVSENQNRPDVLKIIQSPSLAPKGNS